MMRDGLLLSGCRVTVPRSFLEIVSFLKPETNDEENQSDREDQAIAKIWCAVNINPFLPALEVTRQAESDDERGPEPDFEVGLWPSCLLAHYAIKGKAGEGKTQMRLSLPATLRGTKLLPEVGERVFFRAKPDLIEVWTPENYIEWLKTDRME